MQRYKVYFKDRLALHNEIKSIVPCHSFDIAVDALSEQTSTLSLERTPDNLNEGDIAVLVNQFGTPLYTGVIARIDAPSSIECNQGISLFHDEWIYNKNGTGVLETTIAQHINTRFVSSADPREQSAFGHLQVLTSTATTGNLKKQDANTVVYFDDFLYDMFDKHNIVCKLAIPFAAGNPSITIGKSAAPKTVLADNSVHVTSITSTSEVFEVNKLVVYNEAGTTLRATYYGSTNGVVTNAAELTRLSRVNTRYIFSDEDLATIKAANIRSDMFNHKIEAAVSLVGSVYDFWSWEIGQRFDVWGQGRYFNSILTGYRISKEVGLDINVAAVTFGKVRTRLTDKFKLQR